MKNRSTKMLMLCAVFAALTAVCSQIQIPLAVIPINLALFAVHLNAALLPKRYAALSMLAYLLLGLAGVPVFVGFRGGVGALFGNTGGYIVGYVVSAYLTAWLLEKWGRNWPRMALAMAAGVLACYAFGTAWYMMLTGVSLAASLGACVLPFLPGDAVKIALAVLLALRLEKPLRRVLE